MNYETIILEKKGKIATLILNTPENLNASSDLMFDEVIHGLEEINSDENITVLVITGAGRAFSAGADIEGRLIPWSERLHRNPQPFAERRIEDKAPTLTKTMPQILIASVNGPALGWGCCLAVSCDLRIASEKATFGPIFVKMGNVPGWGSTYNLPRLVGLGRALELTLTGRTIDAKEAKEIGLVERLVPHDELKEATDALANEIAEYPAVAVEWIKRLYHASMDNNLATQLILERIGRACHQTEDALEAAKAFVEKRKPVFKGK